MTTSVETGSDLAGRFAREAEPLMDALARRARRLTQNHADAEELLQDAMLHAYSGFHGFEPGTNFRAWIFRILQNRWYSNFRMRQCRPGEVLTDDIEWGHVTAYAPGTERSAEAEALGAFAHSDVRAAMGTLPIGVREALYYTVVAGYSYADTARMTGVPLGTVMSRVSRGRKRLRISLAHVVPMDGPT
ncbi:sigma-70 family RNA polymerase sigma factor [Mycobacterium sp. URHB0044]|uniref:sigma-70 family RNA polymerase sigma factor n=1 Tax=Mycobacterium sp. URHB0044 TaxID=1380386 RepID=UPI00048C60FD|nr:sigma-70 family RNA polymerase sigma factor [Mycobacterium sp. URHB0044]